MNAKVIKKSYKHQLFETFIPNLDKTLLVYNHLKENYTKELTNDITDDGSLKKTVTFGIKQNGSVINYISADELLLRLEDKFYNILQKKDDKRKLLMQIIIDWVNGSLRADGSLSSNTL